ncbi:MAG: serine protease [Gemmatimonadota bacterium]|nr:MAG: serine protease [Gemmatimonadota bacterium]
MHRCWLLQLSVAIALLLGNAVDATAESTHAWWVYFSDKGFDSVLEEDRALDRAAEMLTPRALARRQKVRGDTPVDFLDLPVSPDYVRAVIGTGATERHRLRWFNAVTVNATDSQVARIRELRFVARVRRVAQQVHRTWEPETADRITPDRTLPDRIAPDGASPSDGRGPNPHLRGSLNYGECASQLVPIQVDQLHDQGLSGAGVRVAVFDTGFRRSHTALTGVNVVAEWDFVQGDANTENEAGDVSGQHNHGSYVLSILAGFDPGNLIGPAYGAEFLLGKTETLASETPAEEDNWAAAAQWADSLGADIITSSLSYIDWYTWDDLDGDTATITIAADLAAANGISVFTSAGNWGSQDWFYIGPPSDGDSVIAVGAVDSTGTLGSFSSHGPSIDGRTKPDVCAMGVATYFALATDNVSYSRGNGTSFSCPITAGVGALLQEAHPAWGPWEIREALRSTATQAGAPDNDYGWGVIRGLDASGHATGAPTVATRAGNAIRVSPNPSAAVTSLRWSLPAGERALSLELVDVAGRRVRELEPTGGTADRTIGAATWDGRDASGTPVATGVYFARLHTSAGSHVSRVVRIR